MLASLVQHQIKHLHLLKLDKTTTGVGIYLSIAKSGTRQQNRAFTEDQTLLMIYKNSFIIIVFLQELFRVWSKISHQSVIENKSDLSARLTWQI